MRKKYIIMLLAAVLAMLLVFLLVIKKMGDNTPPVISIQGEIVYTEGQSENVLLEGVTAMDDIDGDVTDSIIVEKTSISTDGRFIVYYVAKDSKNNVAKAQREVVYSVDDSTDDNARKYKVMLVNNLGIENLATNWGKILSNDGHTVTAIGLSKDAVQDKTIIYVKNNGDGNELLEYFPTAQIVVGDISGSVNVNSGDCEIFIVLGNNDSNIIL